MRKFLFGFTISSHLRCDMRVPAHPHTFVEQAASSPLPTPVQPPPYLHGPQTGLVPYLPTVLDCHFIPVLGKGLIHNTGCVRNIMSDRQQLEKRAKESYGQDHPECGVKTCESASQMIGNSPDRQRPPCTTQDEIHTQEYPHARSPVPWCHRILHHSFAKWVVAHYEKRINETYRDGYFQ